MEDPFEFDDKGVRVETFCMASLYHDRKTCGQVEADGDCGNSLADNSLSRAGKLYKSYVRCNRPFNRI